MSRQEPSGTTCRNPSINFMLFRLEFRAFKLTPPWPSCHNTVVCDESTNAVIPTDYQISDLLHRTNVRGGFYETKLVCVVVYVIST